MTRRISWTLLATAVVIGVGGCAENKLTRHNFALIHEGKSTKLEVEKTLGEEHLIRRGSQWEYDDMDRHLTVYVDFNDRGVVTRKQWVDARTGEWDDTKPEPEGEKVSEETSTLTHDDD